MKKGLRHAIFLYIFPFWGQLLELFLDEKRIATMQFFSTFSLSGVRLELFLDEKRIATRNSRSGYMLLNLSLELELFLDEKRIATVIVFRFAKSVPITC